MIINQNIPNFLQKQGVVSFVEIEWPQFKSYFSKMVPMKEGNLKSHFMKLKRSNINHTVIIPTNQTSPTRPLTMKRKISEVVRSSPTGRSRRKLTSLLRK
jgi:hypothetical protein